MPKTTELSKGTPILLPEPQFESVFVSGDAITAQVSGLVTGWTIILESSANLRDWGPIRTNVASGLVIQIRDIEGPNRQQRFYSARLQQP